MSVWGAEGIARIVDDVMAAHLANLLVPLRFEHIKDMDHAKRRARDCFCPIHRLHTPLMARARSMRGEPPRAQRVTLVVASGTPDCPA
jgi:hypothetical protein